MLYEQRVSKVQVASSVRQLFVICDALSVLFQISFVQQRPVPCTGLHCTPPRKAREIEDPKVPCPLHLALCSVLCLCVLFCVSVFCSVSLCLCVLFCVSVFCARRWSSKPDLFALPHARRRRQRNTCFSISFVYVRNVLLLVLVHQLVAEHVGYTSLFSFKVVVFRMQYSASCPGWYSTPRFTKFPSSSFLLMKQNPSNKRL